MTTNNLKITTKLIKCEGENTIFFLVLILLNYTGLIKFIYLQDMEPQGIQSTLAMINMEQQDPAIMLYNLPSFESCGF